MAAIAATKSELKPLEKKALLELRIKLEDAIHSNRLLRPPNFLPLNHHMITELSSKSGSDLLPSKPDLISISLWGVPLLPSRRDPSTDILLLSFLRAADFNPLRALNLLRRTLLWRRDFAADHLFAAESLPDDLENLSSAAVIDDVDRLGRPVIYDDYNVFRDLEFYDRAVGPEERREKFVRWRVMQMERAIAMLSFKPGGVATMIQVTDLKDAMDHGTKELRAATNEAFAIFHDYYPDLVVKHILINVSFRHFAYHTVFSRSFSQRSKSKYIFARPSKVTETLLKFIAPEKLPVRYGGLKREDDEEFTAEDAPSELIVKGGSKGSVEIPIIEAGVTVIWDIAAVGWEVNYAEEFIPEDECSYRVLIRKEKKLEESVRNSFYIREPGKVVLTVENRTYKKKRVLYRSKSKPTVPLYSVLK